METNLVLQQTIASFFNVEQSRISIESDRALIQCDDDAQIYEAQERWSDASYLFGDRLRYIVIQCGDYKRTLPLNLKIWTSGQLVKP
ncbi:hypothetical protein [Leptolyngbya sp. NIES-2104]|uniref:hypothetical protein n=1 Tax=Leptolyngbya sp. NIES-2104 TaxID=1552121 RepID=UPI0006ECA9B4|nr:hypothetical protein [Leptolyngbya sp. NIES-2104]GAP96101.1 hypothetical protein NIES2104_26360 [Leptolyngbya sp. NIES-2104]